MIDARISVALPSHPKTKKLIKRLGTDAAWRLVCLFLWVAQNKPDGDLIGMQAEDIELAVDWPGADGTFVSALVSVGFIEGSDASGYVIHDWIEHNPWAAGSEDRSEKARFNALCKHHGRDEAARRMPEYAEKHAKRKKSADENGAGSNQPAIDISATSMLAAETSSAPSPSPSPSPSPKEEEQTLVASKLAQCPHQEILSIFSEELPDLPQPRVWEGKRADALLARWRWVLSDLKKKSKPHDKAAGLEFFRRMFGYISKSDFLMGRKTDWSCSLPWIVEAENFAKIIEGNFEPKEAA